MGKTLGVVLLCACAATAGAQTTTSSILGQVRADTGAALPGAEVTARHLESGLVRTTTAEPTGHFALAALPVGTYEVRASLPQFRPLVRRGIALVVGEPVVLSLTLTLGATEDEITVTAEATGVRTRSGDLSYLVSEATIRDLPLNGRNYTDLGFLQPGVVAFPHREGGSVVAHGLAASVNGQDPRSNVYLLDGTLMNDFTNSPAGSAAGTTLGTETVREFRVEANAYGAEYGRNFGGQVNVITKSGTNGFHGSAYEYHRNDAFDARNYFDPTEKPDFRRNQFGATVGGPLRRDRTFFFVGYEGLRETLGRTIQTVVPDEAARSGVLPGTGGGTVVVPVSPAVQPYLDEFPLPNGEALGGGLAAYSFPF
ncbi:MAG TPA: carboxypeptidase-like regulatory domain-containing protein, partial [Vicinamibacteria bacterium]|nr:carboxypeptidase-like regulatory domain-containing protein [Vicinamibacteria bacterium]